jgi:hypothetical protein
VIIKTCTKRWTRSTASGTVKPKTHILTNKAPGEFKKEIQKRFKNQCVLPDNHTQNLVEQVIKSCTNDFKAILAGVDDTFLMQLWDTLLVNTNYTDLKNPNCTQSQHGNMFMATLTITKCSSISPKKLDALHKDSKMEGWREGKKDVMY